MEPTAAPSTNDEAVTNKAAPTSPEFPYNEHVIPLHGSIVVPDRRDAAGMPSGLIVPGNLNFDKQPDLVVLLDDAGKDGTKRRRVVAISGADHSVLWSVDSPLQRAADEEKKEAAQELHVGGLRPLPDINADGTPDIFILGPGERPGMAALSGRNGDLIGINAKPKNRLIHLVDVREVTGDSHPDLIFATRLKNDAKGGDPTRIGFAVFSTDFFQRVVSLKRPFGRMSRQQTLLYGPFPDCDGDKIDEILCYGIVPANRITKHDEAQFSLVDGRHLKRWVLARTDVDPTIGPAFITSPGVIIPNQFADLPVQFADLVISTPADVESGRPSQIGCYVLKEKDYHWVLSGEDAANVEGGNENAATTSAAESRDVQFGAPLVVIPDLDDDSVRDVATTIIDPNAPDARRLVAVSSRKGRIIRSFESPAPNAHIEKQLKRVQMAVYATATGATRVAATGTFGDGNDRHSAIILYDVAPAGQATTQPAP